MLAQDDCKCMFFSVTWSLIIITSSHIWVQFIQNVYQNWKMAESGVGLNIAQNDSKWDLKESYRVTNWKMVENEVGYDMLKMTPNDLLMISSHFGATLLNILHKFENCQKWSRIKHHLKWFQMVLSSYIWVQFSLVGPLEEGPGNYGCTG